MEKKKRVKATDTKPSPEWIIEKCVINDWPGGEFSVQITKPYERKKEEKGMYEVTLYKSWWSDKDMSLRAYTIDNETFKNRRTFIIKNLDDYEAIRDAIENRFTEKLKWKIKGHISKIKIDSEDIENIKKIVETSPKTGLEFVKEITKFIGRRKEEGADLNFLKDLSTVIFDISDKVDSRIFESLKCLIPKLAAEKKEDIESFNSLLGEYGLRDINTLTQMITQRLKAIKFFDELVTDDSTKEMSDNKLESMHYFLEQNMWILDEKYEWFLSNRQLKTLIKQGLAKKYAKYEKKRPDFALAHEDEKNLIIAEIKRPSHSLSLEDMNQLMRYRTLAEKHMGKQFNNFRAYLIGRQMNADLRSNKRSLPWLEVITYTSITSAARKRYREFLDVLEKKKENLKIR